MSGIKYTVFYLDSNKYLHHVAQTNSRDDAKMIAEIFEWRDKVRYHNRKYDFKPITADTPING